MIKNILSAIAIILMVSITTVVIKYDVISIIKKTQNFSDETIPLYMEFMGKVLETGDAAKAMVLEYKVLEDVSNEDVADSIKALAEEHNMILTGDTKMFTKKDAIPTEVKHARIFSLCSLTIAKQFLNYSREFGGFMPCRIMLIEMGNGDRFLYSMDLKLMIYGGFKMEDKMFKLASKVDFSMRDIAARAAEGDF
jgi:uncharacterized protein (DUF302 family)